MWAMHSVSRQKQAKRARPPQKPTVAKLTLAPGPVSALTKKKRISRRLSLIVSFITYTSYSCGHAILEIEYIIV